MYVRTGIGDLYQKDPALARAELVRVIGHAGGNLRRAARELVVSRRHLYRLIERDNLFPEVELARERAKAKQSWIDRARTALGG